MQRTEREKQRRNDVLTEAAYDALAAAMMRDEKEQQRANAKDDTTVVPPITEMDIMKMTLKSISSRPPKTKKTKRKQRKKVKADKRDLEEGLMAVINGSVKPEKKRKTSKSPTPVPKGNDEEKNYDGETPEVVEDNGDNYDEAITSAGRSRVPKAGNGANDDMDESLMASLKSRASKESSTALMSTVNNHATKKPGAVALNKVPNGSKKLTTYDAPIENKEYMLESSQGSLPSIEKDVSATLCATSIAERIEKSKQAVLVAAICNGNETFDETSRSESIDTQATLPRSNKSNAVASPSQCNVFSTFVATQRSVMRDIEEGGGDTSCSGTTSDVSPWNNTTLSYGSDSDLEPDMENTQKQDSPTLPQPIVKRVRVDHKVVSNKQPYWVWIVLALWLLPGISALIASIVCSNGGQNQKTLDEVLPDDTPEDGVLSERFPDDTPVDGVLPDISAIPSPASSMPSLSPTTSPAPSPIFENPLQAVADATVYWDNNSSELPNLDILQVKALEPGTSYALVWFERNRVLQEEGEDEATGTTIEFCMTSATRIKSSPVQDLIVCLQPSDSTDAAAVTPSSCIESTETARFSVQSNYGDNTLKYCADVTDMIQVTSLEAVASSEEKHKNDQYVVFAIQDPAGTSSTGQWFHSTTSTTATQASFNTGTVVGPRLEFTTTTNDDISSELPGPVVDMQHQNQWSNHYFTRPPE